MNKSTISKVMRHIRSMATTSPRPKVMRPCDKCGNQFGARELRAHRPHCIVK